jgi:hypothetical protein
LAVSISFSCGFPALALKITAKRELLQFDSAHFYAEKLLAVNRQNVYALSTKARILLKQKKDQEALAKQGYQLNDQDGHSTATLAMAYHFTNDTKGRDALLKKAESDTTIAEYITVAKDIISGKESFRN